MNMQNENHEFDKLLKLLAIKRLEKPPRGYFDNFSARVIDKLDKIQNPEEQTGESLFVQLWKLLIAKPALAGAFVLIFVAGIIALMRPAQTAEIPLRPGITQNNPWELNTQSKQNENLADISGLASGQSTEHSSTNPVTSGSGAPSLFQQIPTLVNPTPANYSPRQ
jgi:hypothetical protein